MNTKDQDHLAAPSESARAEQRPVELPRPDIRVTAFGEVEPTDGRSFVMGDFYSADQMRAALGVHGVQGMEAPSAKPIAQLVIRMDTHDMGQSLAPNPPFKSHRIMVTDWTAAAALPLGTYQLAIVASAGTQGKGAASGGKEENRPLGCALAMRVMQSDLYPLLDGAERADCDELVRQNLDWFKRAAAVAVVPEGGQSNG